MYVYMTKMNDDFITIPFCFCAFETNLSSRIELSQSKKATTNQVTNMQFLIDVGPKLARCCTQIWTQDPQSTGIQPKNVINKLMDQIYFRRKFEIPVERSETKNEKI